MSLAILLVAIILLFLLRVPMAFAILGPCLAYLIVEGYSLGLAVRLMVGGINSWPLLAVPLFILVGIVATRTEIAARLYDAVLMLLGPLRAGLAYVNIGVSLGFSWMSGAALADAAGIGSIEVDHMRKKGYPAEFSVGLSASSALISPIMPPSIPAVVFASVAAVSTGALFAAAVVPAVLMTIALGVTVWVWARRRPDLVGDPYDWPATGRALVRALPPMGAPVLILGGILGGWFTPTEAAGIGALYMLVLAALYRGVDLRGLGLIFRDTASITAQIMLIIGASSLLSWILAREQVPQAVATALLGFTDNPIVFLLVINVVLLLLGMILEPTSAADRHADPVAGRGRVRGRPAAVRLDRHLQPHDRAAHPAHGRGVLRAQLGHEDPRPPRLSWRGDLHAGADHRAAAHHVCPHADPLAADGHRPAVTPLATRRRFRGRTIERPQRGTRCRSWRRQAS